MISRYAAMLLALLVTPAIARADSLFEDGVGDYFAMVRQAQSEQPAWASPIVSTNPILEERYRFDTSFQKVGNGEHIISIDGGKGLDLIVSPTEEIQIGSPPYTIKQPSQDQQTQTGFGDWPFFRFKQRLLSAPEGRGNYVLSTWLQVQAPVGVTRYTNNSWTLLPTIGGGKAWGPFGIQATAGATIPVTDESGIGSQVTSNLVLQYHLFKILWPELEANYTYFPDGPHGGKNQLYITPGVVVGRIPITDHLKLTLGLGYQTAIEPHYRATPLLPAYNNSWILSTRVSF